jgi:lipoprotein NlpI
VETSDPAVTIQYCNEAIQSGQLTPERLSLAFVSRGFAHANSQKLEDAMLDFDEAIRINSHSYVAFVARANLHHQRLELDRSIADYNEVIRLNPNFAEAFNDLAVLYWKKRDQNRAIENFNQAITLRPKFAGAYNNRGVLFLLKGQFREALVDFEVAARLSVIEARYDLIGRILFYSGRFVESTEAMKIAVGRDPKNINNYLWLYLAQARSEGVRKAETELIGNMNYANLPNWQVAVSEFLLGKIDENGLFSVATDEDSKSNAEKQCVVTFYAAQARIIKNDFEGALPRLRTIVRDCEAQSIILSHIAVAELKRLKAN